MLYPAYVMASGRIEPDGLDLGVLIMHPDRFIAPTEIRRCGITKRRLKVPIRELSALRAKPDSEIAENGVCQFDDWYCATMLERLRGPMALKSVG